MAFTQDTLRPLNNYFVKRSYTLYLYTTDDTANEILVPGYFSPNTWIQFRPRDVVMAQTSEGLLNFVVLDDVTSVRLKSIVDLVTDPDTKTSTFEAQLATRYRTDTSAGGYSVTIAPDFQLYGQFRVVDVGASWNDNFALVVDFDASGYAYQGVMGDNFTGNVPNDAVTFIYMGPDIGFELW